MKVRIYRDKWGDTWKDYSENMSCYKLGLIPDFTSVTCDYFDDFTVYDKEKFFLSVIKHGIVHEEVHTINNLQ